MSGAGLISRSREELEAENAKLRAALNAAGIDAERISASQAERDDLHRRALATSRAETVSANAETRAVHEGAEHAARRHERQMERASADLAKSRGLVAQLQASRTALALSEARQRAIFDSATDFAMIVTDPVGTITDWSPGAERVMGWKAAEVRGRNIDLISTPEGRAAGRVVDEMKDALQAGRTAHDGWHLRKNGQRFWASGQMMPLRDGEAAHLGFVKILRDRTAEHRAGLALEETQERYRLAGKATNDAVWDWDLTTNTVLWNASLTEAYGHRPEGMEQTGDWWIAQIHPDDRARIDASIHAVIDGAGSAWSDAYRFRRADGAYAEVLDRGHVIRDHDGRACRMIGAMLDLTQLRSAETALRESEERFKAILNTIDAAFAIVEVKYDADDRPIDYRFIEANPAFEHQAGVNLRGKWVTEFAPDLEQFWFDTYGHVAKTGEPANFESYARAFQRWFDVRAVQVGDPADRQIAIFFSDVTARRQLEARNAATQELSDRLRDLTEPHAIAATAAEILGKTLEASLVGYGTVDLEAETLTVGQGWAVPGVQCLPSPIKFRDFGSHFDDLRRGETVVVADVAQDPRSVTRAPELDAIGARAFISLPLFEQGRFVALLFVGQSEPRVWTADEVLFVRDVTERIRAAVERAQNEKDLRVSEARANAYADRVQLALAAGAIIGTWVWDLPTDQFTVDEAFARAFGLDPSLGRAGLPLAQIVATVHPDDQAGLAAAIEEVVARGGAYAHQYRVRRADGRYYWIEANGRVDHAPDGTPLSFPGVVLDVEERRAVEAERDRNAAALRALNDTLEQRVAERTAELMRAEDQLRHSQKMEAVGQLTGGLAHDFNNLLAGISGSLELMNNRINQGRLKDVEKYMVAAMGATKRAASLTHRLLAFSRRQTLDPKATNVNTLVSGMVDLIQRTVGPSVQIETICLPGLWSALVDPSQLENALLNLCINARDAMPDGGRITIETGHRWIDAQSAKQLDMRKGPYLSLAVSDTGTGMPPEVIAKAFEPFFTTKPLGQGTGLGLSMIYGFAKQSGGQVRIHSKEREGTTVSIFLPRYRGEAEPEEVLPQEALPPVAEAGETVLIVDDEPTVRMLVTDVLGDLGYTAIEAVDGAGGLKVLQSDARIDLLVTDVGLPGGLNGRQLADAARVTRPDLKVLFITGYAENALLTNGRLETGMAVLTKPFAVDILAARIRDLIAH